MMSIPTAKKLRKNLTEAERVLWAKLRNKQLHGLKFRRQVALGSYVVDFICHEKRLVIEIDGGQHSDQKTEDEKRTAWLENQGYQVIRFWNNDVLSNIDGVVETITEKLK